VPIAGEDGGPTLEGTPVWIGGRSAKRRLFLILRALLLVRERVNGRHRSGGLDPEIGLSVLDDLQAVVDRSLLLRRARRLAKANHRSVGVVAGEDDVVAEADAAKTVAGDDELQCIAAGAGERDDGKTHIVRRARHVELVE